MDFRAKNNLLNKTHMKNYFVLAMIAIISVNSHATPKEFWRELPCISRKQCDLDAYIGSQNTARSSQLHLNTGSANTANSSGDTM